MKLLKKISALVRLPLRRQQPKPAVSEQRVTNETVAAHREEILGSARKFIYPLQASRHRIVKVSIALFVAAVITFFAFCLAELYKFQSTSIFIYGISRVLPFPVAIIGNRYVVAYGDYLFELRHYMHYNETQQHVAFNTPQGKQQLVILKQRSLDQILQQAYVQQLARQNHVYVSENDIDAAQALLREENRLGANDQVFESVLSEFYGWSVDDFRHELAQEILAQKVVNVLDSQTHNRANNVLAQLKAGGDFAQLAKQNSDDAQTRDNGGAYGALISPSDANVPPQVADALFKLQPGQYSDIINTGYSLEIVKVLETQAGQVKAAHISFNFQPITAYTAPLQAKEKPLVLIRF